MQHLKLTHHTVDWGQCGVYALVNSAGEGAPPFTHVLHRGSKIKACTWGWLAHLVDGGRQGNRLATHSCGGKSKSGAGTDACADVRINVIVQPGQCSPLGAPSGAQVDQSVRCPQGCQGIVGRGVSTPSHGVLVASPEPHRCIGLLGRAVVLSCAPFSHRLPSAWGVRTALCGCALARALAPPKWSCRTSAS